MNGNFADQELAIDTVIESMSPSAGFPGPLRHVANYDRSKVRPGIAHFGVGNFHRAHQAFYAERYLCLPGHEQWGIVGIGILDTKAEQAKAKAMERQECLYSLTVFSPDDAAQCYILGSIKEYMHAPNDPEAVVRRLTDAAIKIVTMTVTEWGYNLNRNGEFDFTSEDVNHDLCSDKPKTIFGFLTEALRRRRDSGIGPFTVMSCDNLPHNGRVIQRSLLAFVHRKDPGLASWIKDKVTFPSCMVDRITPVTLPYDVVRLNAANGLFDEIPVYSEEFIQWVIEDNFCAGRPQLENLGVQFTDDIDPYEQVKIRMLNASHSMMAYPGLLAGYRYVDEVLGDHFLKLYIHDFLHNDVGPLLKSPLGICVEEYGNLLISRFGNIEIKDQILRIGSEGTHKIPLFLYETFNSIIKLKKDHRRLAFFLASFCEYLKGRDDCGNVFPVVETNYNQEDRSLIENKDLSQALLISIFRDYDFSRNSSFVRDFVIYRKSIQKYGTIFTLKNIYCKNQI